MTVEPKVSEWVEVRVTGQPPGDYPPYDFTFRSDTDAWGSLPGMLERATGWENVEVVSRQVHVVTTTSEWAEWKP